ncbi:MAG: hypothetical protein ABI129_02280 [Rhodanobacter sp.]
MLQAIAAILWLSLLVGVFGRGMDTDDDVPATPAENAGANHGENDFDGAS